MYTHRRHVSGTPIASDALKHKADKPHVHRHRHMRRVLKGNGARETTEFHERVDLPRYLVGTKYLLIKVFLYLNLHTVVAVKTCPVNRVRDGAPTCPGQRQLPQLSGAIYHAAFTQRCAPTINLRLILALTRKTPQLTCRYGHKNRTVIDDRWLLLSEIIFLQGL